MPNPQFIPPSSASHDPSLIEWFSKLTPEQRLAELESRVDFFWSLRADDDAKLSRDSGSTQSTPVGNGNRYEDLVSRTSEVALAAGTLRVLDLKELIRQKKALDRPKDRAVAELLEQVLRNNEGNR